MKRGGDCEDVWIRERERKKEVKRVERDRVKMLEKIKDSVRQGLKSNDKMWT